jgi:hypothetical protein
MRFRGARAYELSCRMHVNRLISTIILKAQDYKDAYRRNGKQCRKAKECGLKECGTHTRGLRAESLMQLDQYEWVLKVFGARENWEHDKSNYLSRYNANSWFDPVPRFSSQRVGPRAKSSQDFAKGFMSHFQESRLQTFTEQHDTF